MMDPFTCMNGLLSAGTVMRCGQSPSSRAHRWRMPLSGERAATDRASPAEELVQGVVHPGGPQVDDHQVALRFVAIAVVVVRGPP